MSEGVPADWPGPHVIRQLVENACGLFIWASTACRYIRDGKLLATRRIAKLTSRDQSLAGPQKQLDEIYITVLKDSTQQGYEEDEMFELYDRFKLVIGSIALTSSPLSATALAKLLQKDVAFVNETLADLHTIINIPGDDTLPIRLHHPTFRDFLLDKNRCTDLNFWVDEREAHLGMADGCITVMSELLKRDLCDFRRPGTAVVDIDHARVRRCIPTALRYSCLYWVDHYRQAVARLRDGDKVDRFLQTHFLHWLEVLSLIGEMSQTSALIRMYQAMLPVSARGFPV